MSKIHPSIVRDGTAMMYETSVKRSEKRTPAATASHAGSFRQRQSVIACASANAAHWPALRRRSAFSRPTARRGGAAETRCPARTRPAQR